MKRHFSLPVAIACSAHAVFLLGFRSPPRIAPPRPAEPSEKPFTICELVPDVEKIETVESLEKTSGGNPDALRPVSEDKPVEHVSLDDMRMDVTRNEAMKVRIETNIISPGVYSEFGDPGSPGDGPGGLGSGLIGLGELDNTPRTRVQTPPSYPFSLKALGVNGEVLVEFVVDESGRVINPRVVRSSHPDFEGPTLAAVSRWRFEPGMKNGKRVRFRMSVPVKFNLND